MALLGNLQRNGYVAIYPSTRDRIFGTEGSTWTSPNGNIEVQNDEHKSSSLSESSSVNLVDHNKELMKQTILKQEAIFREQIQELHRLYNRQRELMDELKRNELYRLDIMAETSWPKSFLANNASSKNTERIHCPTNSLWPAGQSSAIVADSIKLPSSPAQEITRPTYLAPAFAPTPTEGHSKDSKLPESKYRNAGKRVLDLHLPADAYINTEEGKPLEDEMPSKLPRLSAYTLTGVSEAVRNSDKRPYGANPNGFTDLNEWFKVEEAAARSGDLMSLTSHRLNAFLDLSARIEPHLWNFPNGVDWNSFKGKDPEGWFQFPPPSELEKKHEWLSSMNSSDQFNLGPWSGRKFTIGESYAGTQGPINANLLGPSGGPCQPVSEADIFSGISPLLLRGPPVSDKGESQIAVHALPGRSSTSALLDQSSKLFMGLPGLARDEVYRSRNVKSGPSLDPENFVLRNFGNPRNVKSGPSLDPQNFVLSNFGNRSSSTSHELGNYIKGAKEVETALKNINLNVMPANFFDATAFQSIKEDLLAKGKGKLSEEDVVSTHVESLLLKPSDSGVTHGFELLKMIDEFNINGEPDTSSKLHPQTENQKIEEIEKGFVSDVNSPGNHAPHLEGQVTGGENLTKNEPEGEERKCVAGIIDLNLCMNEDENMQTDIDLQAPVSPENKESSPPRGESDENQLEMPYQLVGQEQSDLQVEEAKIAAEILFSISALAGNNGPKITTHPPSESSISSSLHWFASIASSVADHPKNDTERADFTCKTDLTEFPPANIDYFEAMTLKLTETKVVDCFDNNNSNDKKEKEGGSPSPTMTKKGWNNRVRQRKDFLTEILPSLASLSRYEVTEDLQAIGGLMEAAGSSGTHSGRNAATRGRKRSCASASNNTDSAMKQHRLNGNAEMGIIEKKGLLSWGTKRPRWKRYTARNFSGF